MERHIVALAEALRDYCYGHSCKRCFFKSVCDKHFSSAPAVYEWVEAIYNMEHGDNNDSEE